jgi:glucosamine-6-phosphate deaminase
MRLYTLKELHAWCSIPYDQLEDHPDLKIPFRLVRDSGEMGMIMAEELVDLIGQNSGLGEETRAIIPCGPSCWYTPFTELVNRTKADLSKLVVFHMDDCLDWQGKPLPEEHPYNFRTAMERQFYDPVDDALAVPEENRNWLRPGNIDEVLERIYAKPLDITYGGWGQDGHIAYNQARRDPFSQPTIDDVRNCTIRVQMNNLDTILTLAQRSFGVAYQFVPPMSVTLGVRECLSAKKVRLFSDTGTWKQTALRVALFGPVTPEYPMTLLQEHDDALLTATVDTARHPISEHPEWDLGV